jgi:transcriptional regulator GlxA family with amidase domain
MAVELWLRLYFKAMRTTKRIGFLGYDGLQALDLVGPLEAFMTAAGEEGNGNGPSQPRYEVLVIGLTDKPFTAETGITLHPQKTIEKVPALDTLIIPGGKSLRSGETSVTISQWLKKHAGKIRRIASVCTGVYALAPTGLLDGRRVTTHWRCARSRTAISTFEGGCRCALYQGRQVLYVCGHYRRHRSFTIID